MAEGNIIQGISGVLTPQKTILGFFSFVLGLIGLAAYGITQVLSRVEVLHSLVPWVLAFAASYVVLLSIVLILIVLISPEKLMLGQVSGEEYRKIKQQLRLGDSTSGEREEKVAVPSAPKPVTSPTKQASAEEKGG